MEIWKEIHNYVGLYAVSNLGNVKSLARTIINKNGRSQKYNEKLLKWDITKHEQTSYARVTLCKDHIPKRFSVHRLVAEAFIPNDNCTKNCVNHIDNNGLNNPASNLEWCTHSENMIHAQKQGRLFNSQSKGGTKGGAVGKRKMLQNAEKLVGTQVADWTILSSTPSIYRAKKNYLPCKCKCGILSDIELGRLIRKEVTCCVNCAKSK